MKLSHLMIMAKTLKIDVNKDDTTDMESIEIIISKYKKHPSILKIKDEVKVESKFKFC